MSKVCILHNNRCSKSREAHNWMADNVKDFETVNYLETPPTKKEILDILKKLDLNASQIVRKGEPIFKEKFKGKELSEEEWLNALVEYPKLIERPIVIKGEKAAIGRPLENISALFE